MAILSVVQYRGLVISSVYLIMFGSMSCIIYRFWGQKNLLWPNLFITDMLYRHTEHLKKKKICIFCCLAQEWKLVKIGDRKKWKCCYFWYFHESFYYVVQIIVSQICYIGIFGWGDSKGYVRRGQHVHMLAVSQES